MIHLGDIVHPVRFPRRVGLALVALSFALAACAGPLPPDATPHAIAREECRIWLGRVGFARGVRRGTQLWDRCIELCVAQHLGPAGELDRAEARRIRAASDGG